MTKPKKSETRRLIKKLGTKTVFRREEILAIVTQFIIEQGADPDSIVVESTGLEMAAIAVWTLKQKKAKRAKKTDSWELDDPE